MRITSSRLLLFSLTLLLFFEGLDAYSIFNIPIFWLGFAFFIFVFFVFTLRGVRWPRFDSISIRNWILYGVSITILNAIFNDLTLPFYASTNFFQYISLRLFRLVSFLFIIYTLNYIFKKFTYREVIRYFLFAVLAISTLSLISYFSYIYGYSDFPRTRAGSGGWSQPISRACNILRNYGTFREPSFLAIWTAPFIPYFFYLGKDKKIWYLLSLVPILSTVLSRSLTGFFAILLASFLGIVFTFFIHKKFQLSVVFLIITFMLIATLSPIFSYKFPSDGDICESDNLQDELKNSESIIDSTFLRFVELTNQGLDAFTNTDFLIEYINANGISILGEGYGYSNISFSYAADEASKQIDGNRIIYRNPGQVVSFNNLYANILMSTGLLGFLWFVLILLNLFRKLLFNYSEIQPFLLINVMTILIMYSYQAEEISSNLAIAFAFILNLKNYEK